MYAQISLGEDASEAGLYLLVFFAGFGVASQWGGRIYDARGVRASVLPGCALGAVGFYLWAHALDDFSLGDQWIYIVMAGAGCGLVLGPASTDAVNRVSVDRYGEATGITQTVRNFGASIGLAILGTILIMQNKSNIESSLGALGVPKERADAVADALSQSGGGAAAGGFDDATGPAAQRAFEAVQTDFADATRTVFFIMAGIMVATYVVAHIWLPKGRIPHGVSASGEPESEIARRQVTG
jgi:fucose permease